MARRHAWELKSIDAVPSGVSGVYALYSPSFQLLYIGSSGNIRTRLQSHIRRFHQCWYVKVATMDNGWYEREQKLIRRLTPCLNKRIVNSFLKH